MPTPSQLILASASPRRQQILKDAGYAFTVYPASVDEESFPATLKPGDVAEFLAEQKANSVAEKFAEDVVLGADTVVAYLDTLLGKPRDPADAGRMLRLLSGTTHSVITGIAVVHAAAGLFRHTRVLSAVSMRQLTDDEIARYVASNEWQGKAGGYGIQDPDPFVTRISGSQTNIVGLPMELVGEMLNEAGVKI